MKGTKVGIGLLIMVILLGISSCGVKKSIPPGEHLLVNNKVKLEDNDKRLSSIDGNIVFKPNKKILGIKFYLWMYKKGTSRKYPERNTTKKWRIYLREKVGEAPVLYDSLLVDKSINNIKNYMVSMGYLDAVVTAEPKFTKRKVKVTYNINNGKLYEISKINFISKVKTLDPFMDLIKTSFRTKSGDPLEFKKLDSERQNIANLLRNKGFYYFRKELIYFEVDSNQRQNSAIINLIIDSSKLLGKLIPYKISSVKMHIYQDVKGKITQIDSLNNILLKQELYFVKPEVIDDYLHFRPGELVNKSKVAQTYNELSDLDYFKLIDIDFVQDSTKEDELIAKIRLSPMPRYSFSIEPQFITSPNAKNFRNSQYQNYGIANNVVFFDRNMFKNAIQFSLSLNTRAETQLVPNEPFLSNFEQSVTASLIIPRPGLIKKVANYSNLDIRNVRSRLDLSYVYEYNRDYIRKALPFKYAYEFNLDKAKFVFLPAEISFNRVNILKKGIFDNLDQIQQQYLRQLFQDNLITDTKLSFSYISNKKKRSGYFQVISNVMELGGNTHRFIRRIMDPIKNLDTSYKIFNVQYYQYLKSDLDIRYNFNANPENKFVVRFFGGLGLPLGNGKILPFERRFFLGGANTLRAWRPRNIGPGLTPAGGTNYVDRSGELSLLGNFEYRFVLMNKFLEGALFLDAGNIWNLNKGEFNQQGVFSPSTFTKELAINTGIGFRFDFSFFILRADWGLPLKDPSKIENERWVPGSSNLMGYLGETVLNIGIGYPF